MFFSPSLRGFLSPLLHGDALPADAIEISDDEHAELLAGLSVGRVVVVGPDGRPTLADVPEPPVEVLDIQARAQRAELLSASDWTQLPDVALTEEEVGAWRVYRRALRDLPQQPGWPSTIAWPEPPA